MVAARIRGAADDIASSVRCWPELIENGPLTFLEANTLGPLMSPGAKAGVVGRWMSLGHFDLAPDQALVIRIPPTGAPYQGSQLADLWFGSLEYASATSSITAEQAHHAPDGVQYLVVSLEDPGYANWLDPAGVAKGIVNSASTVSTINPPRRRRRSSSPSVRCPTQSRISTQVVSAPMPVLRNEPNVGGTSRCDTGADPLSHATMQAWSSISPTPTPCSRRPALSANASILIARCPTM
jgi:hypothetical protein